MFSGLVEDFEVISVLEFKKIRMLVSAELSKKAFFIFQPFEPCGEKLVFPTSDSCPE